MCVEDVAGIYLMFLMAFISAVDANSIATLVCMYS